ncbi:DJ-1/PfpI family protein [Aquincola sp. S2]|uniref:DJ-1/PfpI family protein n=1 Tax=Pseudaquabacterium terrae TaxID=2732868 RepID=A0ABX2EDD2_9BURK|nr:DJ-1/PfpI family protein [Aquabacterium terrae]NRF66642.1 DJ-1/PfpI family protein [Aquabacterium terrae]
MTRRVAILLFPQVEVLDFAGPYEVFTTANRMAARAAPDAAPLFDVITVARKAGLCRARAGLQAAVDHPLDAAPAPDVLIVPGGVVDDERREAATLRWLERTAASAELVASVCTGAFLLADACVLPAGLPVTTHWEDVADLRRDHPRLDVREGLRWVDAGRFVTSAGISAGIDMSLHLVERLAGRALAERTARQMDFAWTENRD